MFNTDRPHDEGFFTRLFRFIRRFFVVMGVLMTVLIVLLGMAIGKAARYAPPALPSEIVVAYDFKPGLSETASGPSLDQPLLAAPETMHDVLDQLARAARDPHVKGLIARLDDPSLSPAQVQELRAAVAKFRAAKKPTAIFAPEISGIGDYYLASGFDQVWLQPVGGLTINGISAEVPFARDLLAKLGITAQFSHKGAYKSMPESFTETGMSAPHREMMTSLVNDLYSQMSEGIAASRNLNPDDVRQAVDASPLGDEAALRLKLVDKLGYEDEMVASVEKQTGAKAVNLGDYTFDTKARQRLTGGDKTEGKRVALITGAGAIVQTARGGFGGMAADKMSQAISDAAADKDVGAIVLRIDSPGGSPAASETIRRALTQARAKGKPVVVSMGSYAASGGYWVASGADRIVAQPGTLTGSIGVFGGKLSLAGLWDKIGLKWDEANAGAHAAMWSPNAPFTAEEKERFDAQLGDIYKAFVARVMEARKMTREQVLAVAEGRVWTGRQAKDKGLVDALGGIDEAAALARTTAKLPADAALIPFPPEKSTLELFMQMATEGNVSAMPFLRLDAGTLWQKMAVGLPIIR